MRGTSLRWLMLAGFLFSAASVQAASAVAAFKPTGPKSFGGRVTFMESRAAKNHSYLKVDGFLAGMPAGKSLVRLQRGCASQPPVQDTDVYVLAEGEPDAKGAVKIGGQLDKLPLGGGRGERGVIGMYVLVLNPSGAKIACNPVVKFSK